MYIHERIDDSRHAAWSHRPAVLATTLAVALAAAACAPATTTYESPGEVATQPPITAVSVPELATDPEEYIGRTITIAGEVNRVLGTRWFTIGGEAFGDHEVLVLGNTSAPTLLEHLSDSAKVMNDIVQVTGVVRIFEEDVLEREIGGIDLDGDVFDPFDAEPVVVMTSLDITPRVDVVPAVAVAIPVPVVREVEVFVADPTPLAGRAAALYDVRVDSVLSSRVFWIGPESGERLLVVLNDDAQAQTMGLERGDMVFVAGVLRRLPANLDDVRQSWGLPMGADAMIRGEAIYLDANRFESLPE